ncbi:MAG: DUF5671 domain-containing protein [Candidatus Paceibacterota bacterium]|jgi:hypothetical protein
MEPTIKKASLTPRFFFVSLGVIVTLITSVSSFLLLFFATLEKKFPDVLNSAYQYGYNTTTFDSIRGSLATLIIIFPVFFILAYFWRKLSKGELGSTDIIIRKWMIYLILFLAAIVIIADLVTLVRYFVAGEITNRFIYKVIGTLVTALIVGKYFYISEFWNGKEIIKKLNSIINPIVSVALVILVIVCSFIIMGSPAKQRLLRLDDRRVSDLQSIQYQVINYWQQKEKLPTTLSELSNPMSGYSLPVDPEFEKGKVYEYIPKDKLSFELCATFSLDMPKGWQEYNYGGGVIPMYAEKDIAVSSYPYPGGGTNESWDHKAGRTCFTRTIDTDIYPPFQK